MRRLLVTLLVVCPSCAATQDATTDEIPIEPQYRESRLVIGSQSLAPLRIFERAEHRVGTHIFDLDETPDGQRIWSVRGDADRAYVLTYEIDEEKEFLRYDKVPRVRVFDLGEREWRPELRIEAAGRDEAAPLWVSAVAVDGPHVAAVSLWGKPGTPPEEPEVMQYQVDCFTPGGKSLWKRCFPVTNARKYDGVHVWGIPEPQYAGSALRSLTWMDDALLVCAEARQPLTLLSRVSGRTVWEMERPWELERGFIGPSVFSFYLGRYGIEDRDLQLVEKGPHGDGFVHPDHLAARPRTPDLICSPSASYRAAGRNSR